MTPGDVLVMAVIGRPFSAEHERLPARVGLEPRHRPITNSTAPATAREWFREDQHTIGFVCSTTCSASVTSRSCWSIKSDAGRKS